MREIREQTNLFFTIFLFCTCLIVSILALCFSAYAQGFMVKPMKIDLTTRPGQDVERIVELCNTTARVLTIDLKLAELTQSKNGTWQAIDGNSSVDTSSLSSCLKWTELNRESVMIEPLQVALVKINLYVPTGARGFYAAALLAQTKLPKPREGEVRIALTIRFLVPILVEIQGRPARRRIKLEDVNIEFIEQSERNPAATMVSIGVVNKGKTYSRLKGSVDIVHQTGKHWQRITRDEFREVGIIPGVELNLKSDLKRRLPSGKYKLKGTLYVDGRRIKPLVKEIDFIGDPTVTKVAADISLTLDPSILSIKSVPGGTRAAAIKIRNLSEEAVNVSVDVEVPKSFRGVSLGELKGEDLGCAQWLKVIPDNFTLRAGRHQNIRIVAKLPRSEKIYANYYATLNFHTTYTDGQSAGKNTSLILLENAKIKAKPVAQIMKVSLAAEEGSRYIIRTKSGNVGDVHFTPECKAIVTKPDGAPVLETALSGQRQVMLPLETRDFSGILDFSRVEEGIYRLRVSMDYGEKTVNEILPIQVSVEEGENIVTVIAVNEK